MLSLVADYYFFHILLMPDATLPGCRYVDVIFRPLHACFFRHADAVDEFSLRLFAS